MLFLHRNELSCCCHYRIGNASVAIPLLVNRYNKYIATPHTYTCILETAIEYQNYKCYEFYDSVNNAIAVNNF